MKKIYKITFILLVLFLSNAAIFAQDNLLYVNKEADIVGDKLLIDFLELEGYTVTFITKDEFKASYADAAAYDGFDALFIGEHLGSSDVFNFHAAGYPIPCVFTEGWALKVDPLKKWSWLSDEDTQFHQLGGADVATPEESTTLIFSGDETTWLGRQYEADEEMIWSSNEYFVDGSNGVALDEIIDDAIELCILPAEALNGLPVGWIIPEGSEVTTDPNGTPLGYTLPNMVYLGLIGDGGQDSATVEFHELIMNSIKWVTGDYDDDEETSVTSLNTNHLNVYPNPTTGMVNVSFTSPVSGTVNVNFYNLAGTLVKTMNRSAAGSTLNLDISDMANANYLYEIITENEVLRGKICKN